MSTLIDNLLAQQSINQQINNYWYIAKPYATGGWKGLFLRIKDAWRVLNGSSQAYHYKEDEK